MAEDKGYVTRDWTHQSPTEHVRSPSPPVAPIAGGQERAFVAVPTANCVQQLVAYRATTVAPIERAAVSREADASTPLAAPSSCVFAIVIPGPGADVLRSYVYALAPQFDLESGTAINWLVIGDPRRSREHAVELLRTLGMLGDDLQGRWRTELATRADDQDVITEQEFMLAKSFGASIDDAPMVLFVVPGSTPSAMPVRLPIAAANTLETAKKVFDVMRARLCEGSLRQESDSRSPKSVLALLGKQIANALLELSDQDTPSPTDPTEIRKQAAVALVLGGATVTQAARAVGLSRQALYSDPPIGERLKNALAQRRRAKHTAVRRGSKRASGTEVDPRST